MRAQTGLFYGSSSRVARMSGTLERGFVIVVGLGVILLLVLGNSKGEQRSSAA
ncbi:MAG: hypothetical protein H7095_05775 [Pseudopedobacter sp.]|nr:hypothetical protein [Deinococcales bacterium]